MAVAQTANAQCPVEEANVWYDQTPLGTQTAQCMTLLQGKPWSGTRDLDTHGFATRDITFLDPDFAFQFWGDVTWRGTASAGGEPMPAAIYGLEADPQAGAFSPKIRNLTTAKWSIVDADLSLIDYRLKFRGANNILSLDNSAIRLQRYESNDLTVGPLIVTVAAASDNYIYGMEGQPGGPIHLNLGSGEALTLKGCGSLTNPSNDFRCWWSDPFNQVVIGSGGVLTLDESYLIVATQNASGNVGNFEIRDGGKVELRTGETTLSVDYLKVVNGGVLDLGPATSLTGPTNEGVRQLDLSAAEIIGQQGAQAALRSLNVSGTSDVTLDSLADI